MRLTFCGGVHPAQFKELTLDQPIKRAKLPAKVIIPLSQHTGAPCQPLVKPGDKVKAGDKIGGSDKFISAPIHASINGTVRAIEQFPHPVLGYSPAIEIEGDGSPERHYPERGAVTVEPGKEEIKAVIREAGVVGLGGAAFPTAVKLSPPDNKKIDVLILNGAECEPYLTCDYRLMVEESDKILEGWRLLSRVVEPRMSFIGIEDNKPRAISLWERKIKDLKLKDSLRVVSLRTKYPQGAEKQLIKAITGWEVPVGGLPFDVGTLVQNVGTALAVWEAIALRKPLFERVITITGGIVRNPRNLRVRIGTTFKDLLEECGGLNGEAARIIAGGPMMGIAQATLEFPVIKGTSGILVLSKEEDDCREESDCIRCGRCIEACPLGLEPYLISLAVEIGDFESAKGAGALDCNECGCCAYVCPSKRMLVHSAKYAKTLIPKG